MPKNSCVLTAVGGSLLHLCLQKGVSALSSGQTQCLFFSKKNGCPAIQPGEQKSLR